MEDVCRAIIKVYGKVQGVGFRYSTLRMAMILNLSGYVRNQNNESVYIEAQGDSDSVRKLIDWCHQGPPRAIVESLDFSFHAVRDYSGFQIR